MLNLCGKLNGVRCQTVELLGHMILRKRFVVQTRGSMFGPQYVHQNALGQSGADLFKSTWHLDFMKQLLFGQRFLDHGLIEFDYWKS